MARKDFACHLHMDRHWILDFNLALFHTGKVTVHSATSIRNRLVSFIFRSNVPSPPSPSWARRGKIVGSRFHDKLVINFMRSRVSYAVGNFAVTGGRAVSQTVPRKRGACASGILDSRLPMSRIELFELTARRHFERGIIRLWPKRVIRAPDVTTSSESEPRTRSNKKPRCWNDANYFGRKRGRLRICMRARYSFA